jgi:hypothetical protein
MNYPRLGIRDERVLVVIRWECVALVQNDSTSAADPGLNEIRGRTGRSSDPLNLAAWHVLPNRCGWAGDINELRWTRNERVAHVVSRLICSHPQGTVRVAREFASDVIEAQSGN